MDTSKFFKQLRQIIKEEVQLAVRNEMNTLYESLDRVSSKVVQEQKSIPSNTQAPTFKKAATKKPATTFSSNPLINDILNETANSGFYNKDFQGILNEDYNPTQLGHDDFNEWPSMRNMSNVGMSSTPSAAAMLPRTDIDGRPVTDVAPEVEQALTRDYSELMKAINAKKGK